MYPYTLEVQLNEAVSPVSKSSETEPVKVTVWPKSNLGTADWSADRDDRLSVRSDADGDDDGVAARERSIADRHPERVVVIGGKLCRRARSFRVAESNGSLSRHMRPSRPGGELA